MCVCVCVCGGGYVSEREREREREKKEMKTEEVEEGRCQTVTSAIATSPGDSNPFDSLCCWFWVCKGLTWLPGV